MSEKCTSVIFSNRAYNAIVDESFRMHPLETGGILLGHILDNGYWVVMEVIPPGINCIHEISYFEYDEEFVNYLANSVASKYTLKLDVLGLWHRHPGSMDVFSGTDDGTNKTFARLNPNGAISGLVNIDPVFRFTLRHVTYPLHYELVEFEVGDDLIPEEFFELKQYPAKGLHPDIGIHSIDEKKNGETNTDSISESRFKQSKRTEKSHKKELNKTLPFVGIALGAIVLAILCFYIGKKTSLIVNPSSAQQKIENVESVSSPEASSEDTNMPIQMPDSLKTDSLSKK